MDDNKGLVTITQEEYDDLLEQAEWLSWLEAAGIDNSEAYEEAIRMRNEENGDD